MVRQRRFPQPDTLVAIVPSLADFAIAEREHWYRIPCKTAPEILPNARWLAFYHTAASGDHRWAIHFIAPIEGVDRALRLDLLPDEPEHPRALEPYFRVRLGPISTLAHPVPSLRRRRLIFIPTTFAKLQAAREINDLYHESPLEDRLWEALRREQIPAERQYYVAEATTSYCLDFAVLCARAGVDVECDGDSWHLRPDTVVEDNLRDNRLTRRGWSVLRFSSRQLEEPAITDAVQVIRETTERLGGIEMPNRVNRRFDRAGKVVEQYRLW